MYSWRLDLSWNGRGYVGWQRQPDGVSIQGEVERCLSRIFNVERVIVHGAGRTDAVFTLFNILHHLIALS